MRTLGIVALFFCCLSASSQKLMSLGFAGDFSFATKGLGLNDGSLGFHLQSSLFCRHRLQLHIETGLDQFLGDKLYEINPSGDSYERNPTIKRIMAGPEFFFAKRISVGSLYGIVWNNWHNAAHPQDGFRFLVTGHLGARNRFLLGASFTKLLNKTSTQFGGLHLGYQIL